MPGQFVFEASHNFALVIASLAVALMAGFTGLSLTHGISALDARGRKFRIVQAAIALGGGIWSMHFIAMLGMQLPISFYYDTLTTLGSALVAVLVVGLALLLLHFTPRTPQVIVAAGGIVGVGIAAMHYIGMAGIRLCVPVYSPGETLLAVLASIVLPIGAIWVAYSERGHKNVLYGTAAFGGAVFCVHFFAMSGTSFLSDPDATSAGVPIDNAALAIVVALASFVICGSFLLMSVRLLPQPSAADPIAAATAVSSKPLSSTLVEGASVPPASAETIDPPTMTDAAASAPRQNRLSVPYEEQGRTRFVDPSDIAAVRAEGRYTILFVAEQKLFCPWSISEAAKRLPSPPFLQAHRSYLINPVFVSRFERKKDSGYCYFENVYSLDRVPVSRGRLTIVRERLGA